MKFQLGTQVKINSDFSIFHGRTGVVTAYGKHGFDSVSYGVKMDNVQPNEHLFPDHVVRFFEHELVTV